MPRSRRPPQVRRAIVAVFALVGAAHCSREPSPPRPSVERDTAEARSETPREAIAAAPTPVPSAAPARAPTTPSATPAATRVDGMLLVPGGTFTMGSDGMGEMDERPAHPVTVASFYLDETEVTNEAYGRCVAARACPAPDPRSSELNHLGPDARFRRPRQPVSSISWDAARGYCAWAHKRLPTEAEFERAARGDDARRYPWGNDRPTDEHAVFSSSVTQDVGTHPRGNGPYGHQDITGNVWEWVEDLYDPLAYTRPGASRGAPGSCREIIAAQNRLRAEGRRGFTGTNPIPTECERVLRGGAFNYDWFGLRSSNRVHHPGRFHLVMSGFRCARDAR